jgi:hypothetical protein
MTLQQFLSYFNPLRNFNNLRYSVGIYLVFNGLPIVFFIRDTLGIGPASNVFTASFWILGLLLMIPPHLFLKVYKPNLILFHFSFLFLLMAIYSNLMPNATPESIVFEIGNYTFIFTYLLLITQIPNTIKDTLVPVIFILSLISNCFLIYSLMIDPNWSLGMRAAITFANENAQSGGNPHIAARNAIVCLVATGVLIWQSRSYVLTLFLYFMVVFNIGIIILTQTKSTFLALILMGMFYLHANFSIKQIGRNIINFFSFRGVLTIVIVMLISNYFLSRYYDVYAIVLNYGDVLFDRFYNVYYTITGVQLEDTASIDDSSLNRVESFELLFESIKDPQIVLIGSGYKREFLDVPVIEAFINHGLIGFFLFNGFLFFLFIYTYKEIFSKTAGISLFAAYLFIYTIPQMVTGGRPYDITYWYSFIIMVRFLGIKYLDSRPSISSLKTV